MTIFKSSKTITVTSSELQEMIMLQRKASDYLKDNNTDKAAIALSFTSTATGILGLAFTAFAPASIALGIVSVLTSEGAATRNKVINNVANGYVELLETRNALTNITSAVRANITLTSDRVAISSPVDFIGSVQVNYFLTGTGGKIY